MRKITASTLHAFENGNCTTTESVHTNGPAVLSYDTALLVRCSVGGTMFYILNVTKYSKTTTDKQNAIRSWLVGLPQVVIEVSNIERGAGMGVLTRAAGFDLRAVHNDGVGCPRCIVTECKNWA